MAAINEHDHHEAEDWKLYVWAPTERTRGAYFFAGARTQHEAMAIVQGYAEAGVPESPIVKSFVGIPPTQAVPLPGGMIVLGVPTPRAPSETDFL